jgi:hypothetical protein
VRKGLSRWNPGRQDALFRDFPSLSRQITRFSYEKEHELRVQDQNLVDTETCLRESRSLRATCALTVRYFAEVNTVFHPVSISMPEIQPLPDPEADMAELRSARDRMKAAATGARSAQQGQERINERLAKAHGALALVRAGFTIRPAEFDLEAGTPEAVAQAIKSLEDESRRSGAPLEDFRLCAGARLSAALRLLNSPSRSMRIAEAPMLQQEVPRLLQALAALAQAVPILHELGRRFSAFNLLCMNRGNHAEPAKVDRVINDLAGQLGGLVGVVSGCISGVAYPFPHAQGAVTLDRFVQPDAPSQSEWERVCDESLTCLDRLFALYYEVLGRLTRIAAQVEDALAPETAPGS